ncbi:hypothetical protein E2C01_009339 [Portunus trituberculatus]|uniref:HTH psq-type domain-containing protein n=1 Tax=Portunus trituberculatus TaxID=210409 RepID=A0A5B7D5G2_PORTR|nr:hypothetical protein [Portunus trituberculatus]
MEKVIDKLRQQGVLSCQVAHGTRVLEDLCANFAEMASIKSYMQEQMERAVELVRSQQMSWNSASKAFGIPYGLCHT